MKTKLLVALAFLCASPLTEALACSVCYGAPGTKTPKSMAVAIWFLMGAIMSVLGGVGAFSFHLWRHSRMPLEPHQQLTEENLEQYD